MNWHYSGPILCEDRIYKIYKNGNFNMVYKSDYEINEFDNSKELGRSCEKMSNGKLKKQPVKSTKNLKHQEKNSLNGHWIT